MRSKVHGILQGLLVGQILVGIMPRKSESGCVVDLKRPTGTIESVLPDNNNAVVFLCQQKWRKLDQLALWAKIGFRLGI
jgi:hypothetical protein